MSLTTTCPGCHRTSEVDDSMLGRFIRCEQCRCMYYIVVPPLGDDGHQWTSVAATSSVSGATAKSPAPKRVETEAERLNRRLQNLTSLLLLNLLIGAILLVLTFIRFLN
jgi:hypothetical protein